MVQQNYFLYPAKFLNPSAKLFFPCVRYTLQYYMRDKIFINTIYYMNSKLYLLHDCSNRYFPKPSSLKFLGYIAQHNINTTALIELFDLWLFLSV